MAAVVDPQRDVELYIEDARKNGLRIGHVIETHLHADVVSGHHELAGRSGFVPRQADDVSPGANLARATGGTREEAEQLVLARAGELLARTAPRGVGLLSPPMLESH